MERFIQLNLHSEGEKRAAAELSQPQHPEPDSRAMSGRITQKRLNRITHGVAHKAAAQAGRSGPGIFTK